MAVRSAGQPSDRSGRCEVRRAGRRARAGPGGQSNLSNVRLLITGGAGFIGSNHVRWVLANTDDEVTVYDALTYAGNRSTLRDVEEAESKRFRFVHADVCDLDAFLGAVDGHDAVLHFAAESHVDRSITGPH